MITRYGLPLRMIFWLKIGWWWLEGSACGYVYVGVPVRIADCAGGDGSLVRYFVVEQYFVIYGE